MAHYAFLNNDATTGTLREELSVLWSEMGNLTSIEEPTEEYTAAIEAKQAEIDAKQQEIDNALCVVTGVITGVLETYEKSAKDETIEQEIRDLEDSRTGKTQEEITAIEAEIQVKIEELKCASARGYRQHGLLGRVLWKRRTMQKNFLQYNWWCSPKRRHTF